MKEKETICGPTYSIRSQGTNLIRDIYPSQCSFIYSNLALNGDSCLIHDTMIIKESGLGGKRMMIIYFTVLSITSNMTSNMTRKSSSVFTPDSPSLAVRAALVTWCILHAQMWSLSSYSFEP